MSIRQETLKQQRGTACSSGGRSLITLVCFCYCHPFTSSVADWTGKLLPSGIFLGLISFTTNRRPCHYCSVILILYILINIGTSATLVCTGRIYMCNVHSTYCLRVCGLGFFSVSWKTVSCTTTCLVKAVL